MKKLIELGEKPKLSEKDLNLSEQLFPKVKILTEQLNKAKIKSILNDAEQNKIKDIKVKEFILRYQVLDGLDTKELRNVIDMGKKEIKKGIVLAFTIFEKKVGVAVGVTQDLTEKYDSVNLVKISSEILGGKGGGGRKDFAQAGGTNVNKIDDAFKAVSNEVS
jgi:alanyl-tRNA synthetase